MTLRHPVSHVTRICECRVSRTNESCHMYKWVMSHIQIGHMKRMGETSHGPMRHVTHTNASCHTHQCVMSHVCMSDVTRMNESCLKDMSYKTYGRVVSHVRMSHVTCANESYHTYERVMCNWRIRHVTRMGKLCSTYVQFVITYIHHPCHTGEWVISHMCISHMYVTNKSGSTYV